MKTIKVIFLLTVLAVSSSAQSEWVGNYFYGEDGGETFGGSKIYIAHNLEISVEKGVLKAHIYSQGYQTSRDLYARGEIKRNELHLILLRTGDQDTGAKIEKGALLLRLIKVEDRLFTVWDEFLPVLSQNRIDGRVRYQADLDAETFEFDESKWQKLTMKKGQLSLLAPKNIIYDESPRNYSFVIWGGGQGVMMEILKHKIHLDFERRRIKQNSKKGRSNSRVSGDLAVETFHTSVKDGRIYKSLTLYSKSRTYQIRLIGKSNSTVLMEKIIGSISWNGKRVFEEKPDVLVASTINLGEVESSDEIAKFRGFNDFPRSLRVEYKQPSLLSHPKTDYDRAPYIFDSPKVNTKRLFIRMVVEFKANGRVGSIVIYSRGTPKQLNSIVSSIRRSRFVPARKNGKYVDSKALVHFGQRPKVVFK